MQTVHDWRINGNIPHWRRAAVVNAAHGLGKQLEPDMATYLGSRERAPKKDKPPAEAQAA